MTTPDDPADPDQRTEFAPVEASTRVSADADASTLIGVRIGPYTLIEAIGEGGMGEVFLAEQSEPIRRRVALKLIRRHVVDALSLAYFEIERQALARMEHPAIARVYDAGRTDEGFPYFVMEYVDGVTLSRWSQATHPDLPTRLRVFVALVRGVQHSHQRGIVHRDLKPDNVLVTDVDGQAQPKLIDFGIAVGIDSAAAGSTGSVHRAGSIDYMSPEQFAAQHGAIDARSDVYSLGKILLELLVPSLRMRGEPTQRPTDLHQRLRASLSGMRDPDLSVVPSELRHLLARALAPHREERYDSAGALADDAQRFIDGRPLRAVPRSRAYALRKFFQRNRFAASMALAALLALAAGLAATLWSLAEAGRETARARATANFLSTVLGSVNPDIARDLDKTLLRKVLDEAAARAQKQLSDQPEVLADIQYVITESYLGLGDHARALEQSTQAYENAVKRYGASSLEATRVVLPYSNSLIYSGKLAEAEVLLRPAIARATAVLGADNDLTLRLRHHLGMTLSDLGRPKEALVEETAAATGLREALGPDAESVVNSEAAMAITLADNDRFDEAIAMMKALIARRSGALGADHPSVLTLRNSLAVFYMRSRHFADGERELKALLKPYADQYGADNSLTLMIHGNLGGALRQQGKVEESGAYYQRAMEGMRRIYGTDHPRSVMSLHNYGNWLLDAGRIDDAERTQADAMTAAGRVFQEAHPVKAEILTSMGKVKIKRGRYAGAEKDLSQSMQMKIELGGADSSRLLQTREAFRDLYTAWGRPDDAARHAEPAADVPP